MNIGLFAKINRYRINTDPALVRTHDAYDEIQKELNKVFGAPDWSRIQQQVNRLGDGPGIGVLAAAYYTVAATKTTALSGLADGLEMLGAALLTDDSSKPPYTTLRWMLGNLRETLQDLPTHEAALSDLYRCQRMGRTLLQYLQSQQQADAVPGVYLLERILEEKIQAAQRQIAQAHAAAPAEQPVAAKDTAVPAKRRGLSIAQLALALLLIALPAAWLLIPQTPDPSSDPSGTPAQAPQALSPAAIERQRRNNDDDPQQREQHIARYTHEIDRLMRQPLGQSLSRAEQLTQTIAQLYPEAESINARSDALKARLEQQTRSIDSLYQRFRRARTQAANLARQIDRLQQKAPRQLAPELQKLTALSSGLRDYALSLSPMLARTGYIEARLNDGDLERAQAQWQNLNTQLAGLAMISQRLKSAIDHALLQQNATQNASQRSAETAESTSEQKVAQNGEAEI